MARVNITVPDDVIRRARLAGLNVSQLATAALVDALDRLDRIEVLDRYLAGLEAELGPVPDHERAAAVAWVDALEAAGTEPGGNALSA